ncbi:hypothetical protein [Pacificoceanicola onchidii]|uniref:hypothetical protein n=1 Tax=Pacificoceanicola onchidii TaxID=2562685 RepID=UPI0010A5D575|nr:hypothetical protein [Pacificoceanicola onchidii]
MNGMLFLTFVLIFVVGPMLCAVLLRLPTRLSVLIGLGLGAVVSVTLALMLQSMGPMRMLPSLILLWLAWVLAVAMTGHAFLRRIKAPRARRWITLIALLTTTLPWFGLATARVML